MGGVKKAGNNMESRDICEFQANNKQKDFQQRRPKQKWIKWLLNIADDTPKVTRLSASCHNHSAPPYFLDLNNDN